LAIATTFELNGCTSQDLAKVSEFKYLVQIINFLHAMNIFGILDRLLQYS